MLLIFVLILSKISYKWNTYFWQFRWHVPLAKQWLGYKDCHKTPLGFYILEEFCTYLFWEMGSFSCSVTRLKHNKNKNTFIQLLGNFACSFHQPFIYLILCFKWNFPKLVLIISQHPITEFFWVHLSYCYYISNSVIDGVIFIFKAFAEQSLWSSQCLANGTCNLTCHKYIFHLHDIFLLRAFTYIISDYFHIIWNTEGK